MARLTIDGYGQLELNQVAFPRDGRIEAQCKLDATDFNDGTAGNSKPFCENGMILAVDNVNRKIRLPKSGDTDVVYALNYSSEHLYDEREQGLKYFKLHAQPENAQKVGAGRVGRIWAGYDMLPRLGYLDIGDKFTTNCIELGQDSSSADYPDDSTLGSKIQEELTAGTPIYGGVCESGAIKIDATAPTNGPILRVIAVTTMPDGQFALKFQVIKA